MLLTTNEKKKLDKYIRVRNFYKKKHRYTAPSLVNGKCIWNRNCNKRNIAFKITCRYCQKYYIGNTIMSFKDRKNAHVGDIRNYVVNDEQSSAFAEYFGNYMRNTFRNRLDKNFVRSIMRFEILWKGNEINCVKNFNSFNCKLYMAEKLDILKVNFRDRSKTINKCDEIFITRRNNRKFHALQEIVPTRHGLQFYEDSEEFNDDTDKDTEKN